MLSAVIRKPVRSIWGALLFGLGLVPGVVYSGGSVQLNPNFPVSRLVYNVVETRALTTGTPSASDTAVRAAFSGSTSAVCSAGAQIRQYGFGTIGGLCGNTTSYKQDFQF